MRYIIVPNSEGRRLTVTQSITSLTIDSHDAVDQSELVYEELVSWL